ncbi:SIS domain-containing protein [Candidatus Nomurabacteria bacterium]|nr:SIS domain-containing protein [Candidatus Nomurabacteria bacterium]
MKIEKYDLEKVIESKQPIVLTGVGKSKRVAQLICDSFQSVNFPFYFIDPIDMMHGSLGVLNTFDKTPLLLLMSKSGRTEETLQLAKTVFFGENNVKIIMITMNPETSFEYGDVIHIPPVNEVDPLNKLPSYSLIEYQKFFFLILEKFFQHNLITDEDFLKNHPKGGLHHYNQEKIDE